MVLDEDDPDDDADEDDESDVDEDVAAVVEVLDADPPDFELSVL